MASAGMAGKGVGSLLTAFGQLKEGQAGAAQYRYKSGMALLNRDLAKQTADYTRKMGEVQAGESGLKSRFQMGKITTAQAQSGIDINSGSAVGVRSSQTKIAQIDQSLIRANAARRAYGYDVEASKLESESSMDLAAGENIKSASKLAAATSILGGASSVADKWSQASQYGLYTKSQASMGGGYEGDDYA